MHWMKVSAVVAVVATVAACEIERTPEPDRRDVEAREVALAEERYDPAAFDTVVWVSQEAAIERGREIYAWVCAECHGPEGRGDGGRVVDGDTIRPPSFQREGWPFADQPEELHHHVFVGNALGMPHWGLRLMRPRDIVALEQYIRLDLVAEAR
jgi:mono/diheme cytochrome c family protein